MSKGICKCKGNLYTGSALQFFILLCDLKEPCETFSSFVIQLNIISRCSMYATLQYRMENKVFYFVIFLNFFYHGRYFLHTETRRECRKVPRKRERRGGSQVAPSCFFWRLQTHSNIIKSYLTSGQCYEGNIFHFALLFSFIPCSYSMMANHAAQ